MSAVISQEAKWLLAILLKYGEILFSTCCYYYWCHKLILTKCIWKRALKDLIFGMSGQVNCNCSPVSLDSWHHLMRLIHFGLVSVSLTCFSISVQRLCLCSGLQRRPTAAPFEGSSTQGSPATITCWQTWPRILRISNWTPCFDMKELPGWPYLYNLGRGIIPDTRYQIPDMIEIPGWPSLCNLGRGQADGLPVRQVESQHCSTYHQNWSSFCLILSIFLNWSWCWF